MPLNTLNKWDMFVWCYINLLFILTPSCVGSFIKTVWCILSQGRPLKDTVINVTFAISQQCFLSDGVADWLMHPRVASLVGATVLGAVTVRPAVTPHQVCVFASTTWRVNSVTSASQDSSTWTDRMNLVALLASVTATPPSAPRLLATPRVSVVLRGG